MLLKLLLLSFLTLVVTTTSEAGPPLPPASPLVTLATANGVSCSGVAVGLNTVLTAKHCVNEEMPSFNDKSCPTDHVIADDTTDNILVATCATYSTVSKMTKRALSIGDKVTMYGHANALPWLYRQGYLSGIINTGYGYPYSLSYVFDMTILPGDSGGPIFNKHGEVVCVVSYSISVLLRGDQIGACFPMKFTKAQLELIK